MQRGRPWATLIIRPLLVASKRVHIKFFVSPDESLLQRLELTLQLLVNAGHQSYLASCGM